MQYRPRPPAFRRDLRRLKKCPSKKFEFPPTQESISSKPSRSNQFPRRGKTTTHRGFTGPTRSQGDDMDTHTNASQTYKWPQPAAVHPVSSQLYCRRRMNRAHSSLHPSIPRHQVHTQQRPAPPGASTRKPPRTHTPPDGREFSRRGCALLAAGSPAGAGAYTTPDVAAQTDM